MSILPRTKKEERNEIEVKVARTGGKPEVYVLEEGATAEDALDAAGITYNRRDRVRINGDIAELDDELEDGDRVTVTGKIQGGKSV